MKSIAEFIRDEVSPHLATLSRLEAEAEGDQERLMQLVAKFVADLIRSPPSSSELTAIREQLDRIEAAITTHEENTVSGLTDLTTNVAALQAEWTTFLADMTTALSNGDSDAAVEQAAQLVAAQTAAMQAADPVTGTSATPAPTADAPVTDPSADATVTPGA